MRLASRRPQHASGTGHWVVEGSGLGNAQLGAARHQGGAVIAGQLLAQRLARTPQQAVDLVK